MNIDNLNVVNEEGLNDVLFHSPVIDEETSKKIVTGYASIDRPWLKFYEEGVIKESLRSMTMYDYICQDAFDDLKKPALNYFDSIINYQNLFDNIESVAAALIEYGVKKGDKVSLITPTMPESIYLLYAINKIGAISNLIDPRTSVEGIEEYVRETSSELVFVIDAASSKTSFLKQRCGVKKIVNISPTESMTSIAKIKQLGLMLNKSLSEKISLEKSNFFTKRISCSIASFKEVINELKNKNSVFGYSDECIQWNEFIQNKREIIMPYMSFYSDGNLPAVIVHTGGTTGKPKGVVLTNNNLNYAAFDCINAGYDFKKEHNWLNIMPLFIAYGCGNGLHLPLVCKMETIIIPAFEVEMMPDLLNKYHPNHMVGVPSHYGTIISSPKLEGQDLSYVIAPVVGGDAMNIELEKETNKFLEEHNCDYKVVKGYGMTEVSAAVCGCTSNEINKLGSVGIPFPHSTIAIFDSETGDELSLTIDLNDKQIGEVCITGPNVMQGYYNNNEENKKIMRKHADGKVWIHSGDLGYMNSNGELFIVGRMKDVIIRQDGFKIFPTFIEEVLMRDGDVVDCKVVGIKDNSSVQGELPYAYVILKEDAKNEDVLDRLSILCEMSLPEYSLPVCFKDILEFPCTNIGKIDTQKLREEANRSLSQKKLTLK